ncbi:hypothetical protein PAXINDRAFT_21113 [Paxillus involutus ATCC 200175]|uniref:Uncharacterized protein n=1 Tax=Paxillus involutus ATCC 200175 TaxID=664439 RepID=A0A0C9STT5_PAXIN|nr:hypothetical protein PAXINDRAFT_21113 [Paxillus involutus ATCC 200175]
MSHPASTSAAHAAEPEPSTSSLHATAVKTNAPAVAPLPSRFKIGTNHKKYLDAHDGKVFCHIPPRVITSPNAPSIPRLFVYENEPVQCRVDGRYGYIDRHVLGDGPSRAPLVDADQKRNELNKVQDIVKNRYMLYKKYKVPECNPRDQGERIMLIMRNNYNHLDCFPLTWRDIITAVAEFQHSAMECFAYFDYHQMILPSVQTPAFLYPEYNPYWLGAFTCNPGVAETLFRAGVPVWLIRHEDMVTANTSLLGPSLFLRQDQMETWQVTPTNAAGTSTAGPSMAGPSSAGTQSALNRHAKCKQRAIKKHRIPAVQLADQTPTERQKASRDETHVTHWLPAGYRYPEPTVFANVGASASRKRYLANWLALHPTWLAHIAAEPTVLPTPPMWRMFLNSQLGDTMSATRAGAKKAEARAFFADALGDVPLTVSNTI